jgi:hypothetical protein
MKLKILNYGLSLMESKTRRSETMSEIRAEIYGERTIALHVGDFLPQYIRYKTPEQATELCKAINDFNPVQADLHRKVEVIGELLSEISTLKEQNAEMKKQIIEILGEEPASGLVAKLSQRKSPRQEGSKCCEPVSPVNLESKKEE